MRYEDSKLIEKYRDYEIYYAPKSGQFQVYKDSLDCGFFETPVAAKKKIDSLVRKGNRAAAKNMTAFYRERYRDEEGFKIVRVLSIGGREAYITDEGSRSKVALYELFANTPANEKIFAEIKALTKQEEQIKAKIEALEEKRAPLVPDEKENEDV